MMNRMSLRASGGPLQMMPRQPIESLYARRYCLVVDARCLLGFLSLSRPPFTGSGECLVATRPRTRPGPDLAARGDNTRV